jgi:hypothetical protein
MSQLPGVAGAILPDHKITKYLLDPTHPNGGAGKAKFFGSFGFSQANWLDLKKALLDHARANSVTKQITTPFGEKYVVSCSLITPDGRNPCIVSVWAIEPPDPNPRFVTAYTAGP